MGVTQDHLWGDRLCEVDYESDWDLTLGVRGVIWDNFEGAGGMTCFKISMDFAYNVI